MSVFASDVFGLIQLPAGRCQVALLACAEIAAARGEAEVQARCEAVAGKAGKQLELELDWRATRDKSDAREAASALDRLMDGLLMTIELTCQAPLRALQAGLKTPAGEAALRFYPAVLPLGASHVMQRSYEEQYALMRSLVERAAQGTMPKDAALLGVDVYIKAIADRLDDYKVAIRRAGRKLAFRDVSAGRVQLHEEVCELWAMVLTRTYGDDPAAIDLRAALLAPLNEQVELVRTQRKTRSQPTDLDPATGEELILSPVAEPS
jgi:hypothetical protein